MARAEQMSLMDYQLREVEVRLKLEEGKTLYSTDPISNSERAAEVMADVMKELDRETVCVVNLDNKLRPINYNIVSIGGLTSSVVPVQNVFKSSILSNSYGVLLIHNHPSGNTAPSTEDYEVTRKLIGAGKLLDTPLLDHCIVGGGSGEVYSFRRSNPALWKGEPELDEILRSAKGRTVRDSREPYGAEGPDERIRSFDEFRQQVLGSIRDWLPDGEWMAETEPVKKPGESYTALTVRREGQSIVPAVNLEKYYRQYQAGIPLARLMKEMAGIIRNQVPFGELSWTADYTKVQDCLFIRVSNMESSREVLGDIPWTRREDLMITYHIRIPGPEGEVSSITVSNEMLNRYGILKEKLHADAVKNSMRIFPPVVQSLDAAVQQLAPGLEAPEESPAGKVFVISNQEMTYGAAAAFYPGVLEEVSREVGGNVFILPSSTEEVLALRADDPREYRELERMVREVNRTTVRPSERLSDHVYHFDADSRTFERADAYYTRQMIQQRARNLEEKGERVPAAERTDGSGKLPKAEQTHHWESRERER